MMRKSFKHLFFIAAAGLLASCSIENDIRFPEIHADITAFEVEGQVSSKIDIKTNSVSVVLGEDVKMNDLIIKNLKYTDKAKCSDVNFAMGKKIDLSSPYQVTLSTFKSYIGRFPRLSLSRGISVARVSRARRVSMSIQGAFRLRSMSIRILPLTAVLLLKSLRPSWASRVLRLFRLLILQVM